MSTSLILAIEPDRRQAAQLTSLIRSRVSADLVLAETAEGALNAIGSRVPDLVLIPSLLSPQDDAALAGALRVIAAAARVQMLTIPVLADAAEPLKKRGVLGKWRRGRPGSPVPDGCAPAVFAEQIAAYLAEAVADRAVEPPEIELSAADESLVVSRLSSVVRQPTTDDRQPTTETPAAPVPQPVHKRPAYARVTHVFDEPVSTQFDEEPVYELSLDDLAIKEFMIDAVPSVAIPVAELIVEARKFEPVVEAQKIHQVVEAQKIHPVVEAQEIEGVSQAELDILFFANGGHPTPLVEDVVPRALVAAPPMPPPPAPEKPEWVELIESLRLDIERLRAERIELVAAAAQERSEPPTVAAPVAIPKSHEAMAPATKRRQAKPRPKKTKPIQNEWGFFDPDQCGFAALLSKLEEITEAKDQASA